MLKVEPNGQRGHRATEVAETTTKPAPLRKHSLGVCTVDMPQSNCHRRGISFRCATSC